MEFASEMVVRAAKAKLDIRQLPIEYHARGGESKLSSFRDGWRHLRFLLLHSPKHLFIVPGAAMATLGALVCLMVAAHIDVLGRRVGGTHADRGVAAVDRGRADREPGTVRAGLCHVLHG